MIDSEGKLHFYLNDHLGSARIVIDTAGTVKDSYDYYAFGEALNQTISTGQAYGYTGKPFDNDHGLNLHYYGARYYDGTIGRFISVDPSARKYPAWSPYIYTLNNPIKLVDPDGRDVAFHVYKTARTKDYMHMDLHFQDSQGNWFKYDQGNYRKQPVSIGPSEGPPKGSLLLHTTKEQDKLIARSAVRSQMDHKSGKLEYNSCVFNCKDAAIDVVNNAGAGIEVADPPCTLEPSSWYKENINAKEELAFPVNPDGIQTDGNLTLPSENTKTVVEVPKYEVVEEDPQKSN